MTETQVRGHERSVDIREAGLREQMRWFSTFWVLAALAHFTDNDPLGLLPVLAFGVPVLIFPASGLAFAGFVIAAGVTCATSLPNAANHELISVLIAATFAIAGVHVWIRRRRIPDGESFLTRWLDTARAPAAMSLIVVYLFTVFHKLNSGFFDPATSCAGALLGKLLELNGVIVTLSPTIVRASAIGTIAVESLIMVCLAVPALRRVGLPLGIGFHLVLAPASFWDFATLVFALYMLFVPARVFANMAPRASVPRLIAFGAIGTHLMLATTASLGGGGIGPFGIRLNTLLVLTWYVGMVPMLYLLARTILADRGPWPGWRVRPAVLLIVPLLAFVNGMAPYLGLKTVSSYSMFSNLHTEQGTTNHFFPAMSKLQLTDYERDVVTVTNINLAAGDDVDVMEPQWTDEKPPTTVPLLELRRVVAQWKSEGVARVGLDYQRDGVTHTVADAYADPVLGAPVPLWQRSLLAFRAVNSGDGPNICRW
jgi:hypothetical protein